jgi:hypothetical protein
MELERENPADLQIRVWLPIIPGKDVLEGEQPSQAVPTAALFGEMSLAYEDSSMVRMSM